ncbi:MAG: hypothetical protein LC745_05070 [Planctomycetia bacterium]|nr:hypothetical protein [Planctomycetia bacterium]
MRPDDEAAALEIVGLEGDGFGPDAPAADPSVTAEDADPIAEIDEALLEAELGEFDALLADDELDQFDEQLLDADEDDNEDDDELTLLQELGIIDLDAPDEVESFGFDLGVRIDDDPVDDEVAA